MRWISQLVDRVINPEVIHKLTIGHERYFWRVVLARTECVEALLGKARVLVRMPQVEWIGKLRPVPCFVHILDIDTLEGISPRARVTLVGAKLSKAAGDILRGQILGQLSELRGQPFLGGDDPGTLPDHLGEAEVRKDIVSVGGGRLGCGGKRILQRQKAVVIPEAKGSCF